MGGTSTAGDAGRTMQRSGGGRIAADELHPPQQIFGEFGAAHRLKSARAVLLPDQEQDALLVDETAIDFRDRQQRIPGVDRLAADSIDPDDREILSPHQVFGRREAQIEAAVMEFADAARDGVQPRLELRRNEAARVAMEAARARAPDQRDLDHLARRGNAVKIATRLMGWIMPEMEASLALRPRIVPDQIAQAGMPIADHVRIVAEREREDAAARGARKPRIKQHGLPRVGHKALQDQFGSARKLAEIVAQRRNVVDPPHAVTLPADVGLGNERKRKARSVERRAR